MLPAFFIKTPAFPDEVLKYREPVDPAELLAGLTLEKLNNIYQSILKKQESKIDPIRSKFGTIEKEEVSLSDKMLAMKSYAAEHRKFSFRQLTHQPVIQSSGYRNLSIYPGVNERAIFMYNRTSCLMIFRSMSHRIRKPGHI